jgi:hypothetical protein
MTLLKFRLPKALGHDPSNINVGEYEVVANVLPVRENDDLPRDSSSACHFTICVGQLRPRLFTVTSDAIVDLSGKIAIDRNN